MEDDTWLWHFKIQIHGLYKKIDNMYPLQLYKN